MSMSTHVIGFRPPDEAWRRMKAVWDACKAANLEPPEAIEQFFNYEDPDPEGVEVELEGTSACREYRNDMQDVVEIVIANLPPGVQIVRFYNSY